LGLGAKTTLLEAFFDHLPNILFSHLLLSLPSNAGHAGLIPSQGTRIPHTLGKLSPHAPVNIPSDSTKTPHSQINKYQMASCFLAAVAEVSRTLTLSFSYIHTVATLILP